jgi:hypothetical protein
VVAWVDGPGSAIAGAEGAALWARTVHPNTINATAATATAAPAIATARDVPRLEPAVRPSCDAVCQGDPVPGSAVRVAC